MNDIQALRSISILLVNRQISENEVPDLVAQVASISRKDIYEIVSYLDSEAVENRSSVDPVFYGFSYMAYLCSSHYIQRIGYYNFGRISHTLGVILKTKGDYQSAKNIFKESCTIFEQLKEEEGYSVSLGDYGSACFFIGEYAEAIRALTIAYNISNKYESVHNVIEWSRGLGYALNSNGDYDEALLYANRALSLAKEHNLSINETMTVFANVYENLGRLEKALDISMITLEDSINHKNINNIICDCFNIARLNKRLNRHDLALKYYTQCAELSEKYNQVSYYIKSMMGVVSYNKSDSAEFVLEDLLILARKNGLDDDVNDLIGTLGNHYILKQPVKAVEFIMSSIKLSEERQDLMSFFHDNLFLVRAYWSKNDIKSAFDVTNRLVTQLEQMKDPELKWKFLEKHYINMCLLKMDPASSLPYLIKSIAFLDQFLNEIELDGYKIEFYKNKHTTYNLLPQHFLNINQEMQAFIENEIIKSKILRHSILKDKNITDKIEITNFLKRLNSFSCYVSFLFDDKKLYIFLYSSAFELSVVRKEVDLDYLTNWKKKWNLFLDNHSHSDSDDLLKWLGSTFCVEIDQYCELHSLTNVILSPDSNLMSIPIHAAILDCGKYFIDKYSISYMPSLLMLHDNNEPLKNCLIISHNGNGVSKLSNPSIEAKKIAELIPSTLLGEQDATIRNISNAAINHNMIHIACHSNYIDSSPENSHYQLAEILTARKIANLKLKHVELLFSASCQSTKSETDGILEYNGILRGWLLSGVKNIIGTLWNLDDSFSLHFVENYYRNLAIQNHPLQSFQKTIVDIIRRDEYKSPYYWACLTYFGQPVIK